MKFIAKVFAPIAPPKHGLGRVLYEAGQWCCDNLSIVMVFIPATFLIVRSLYYGP